MKKPLFFLLGAMLAAMLPTISANAQGTTNFHIAKHKQGFGGPTFPVHDTVIASGTAGQRTVVLPPVEVGFTPVEDSIVINPLPATDTVIVFHYTRNQYNVIANLNGGAFTDGSSVVYSYYYEQPVDTSLSTNVARPNCNFWYWDWTRPLTMPATHITAKALYRYRLTWTMDSTDYNGEAATLFAYYVDDYGFNQPADLSYTNNTTSEVTTSAVKAGSYTVLATSPDPVNYPFDFLTMLHLFKVKPFMLTVSGIVVDTIKLQDGSSNCNVVNPGTVNKFGTDAVTLTTTARFSDAVPGNNKSIVANLYISGADAANYQVPDTMLVSTNGIIVEKIQLAFPDFYTDAHGYCDAATINYNLFSGTPDQYMITFSADAVANGFVNTNTWQPITTPGSITIDIPTSAHSNYYSATVAFRNSAYSDYPSVDYYLTFHANMSSATVMALFSDVLAVVDTCGCYSNFQWYHNDVPIPGANEAWYQDPAGSLSGTYHVLFAIDGWDSVWTCETAYTFHRGDEEVKVSAFPNPTADMVSISVSNSPDYSHSLMLMNVMGMTVLNTTFDGEMTNIDMRGMPHGTYTAIVDGMVVRVIKR